MTTAGQTIQGAEGDSITFSIFLNRLNGIAQEMTIALERASMTPILSLCRDYSCWLYDAQARQVAMVDAVPIHTNSMNLVLEEIQRRFDGEIEEGDLILVNDEYAYNTHIGDLVVWCPVFIEGELRFWAAAKGHQMDFGAPTAGDAPWARNVWQEGLRIPPLKIYSRGKPRRDVIEMYLANMRWRDLLEGDLMAMLGSVWTAERRLREMCEEFGLAETEALLDRVIDYARERTTAEIRQMPNGTYRGEAWLDSDGLDRCDVPVRRAVTIRDEKVHVDFAGSAPQADSGINASYAVMQAAGTIPITMSIASDIPHNDGCLKCVTVVAPEGTICNASWPHSTNPATVLPGDAMQEAVWKALVEAIPDRVRAGTARFCYIPIVTGSDGGEGEAWGHLLVNPGGGGGAALGSDGWPLICSPATEGGLKAASVEETELLFPIRFEEWELEPDSMGLGRWIGGPGTRCSIRPTEEPIDVLTGSDAQDNPPHGVLGGTAGRGSAYWIEHGDGHRSFLPPISLARIESTQTWTTRSTGGGGYGDPLERPVERVLADVRDGLISRDQARKVFGVVVSDDAHPTVDGEQTERLRSTIADRGTAGDLLTVPPPGGPTFTQSLARPADDFAGSGGPSARE